MKMILVKIISGYQKIFSRAAPLLGLFFPADCRFWPSCSVYAQEAIAGHGWRRGLWLSLKRIFRCHPLNKGGINLVPEKHFNL